MLSDHIPLEMESRVDIFTLHLYDGDEGELVGSDVCLHKFLDTELVSFLFTISLKWVLNLSTGLSQDWQHYWCQ